MHTPNGVDAENALCQLLLLGDLRRRRILHALLVAPLLTFGALLVRLGLAFLLFATPIEVVVRFTGHGAGLHEDCGEQTRTLLRR